MRIWGSLTGCVRAHRLAFGSCGLRRRPMLVRAYGVVEKVDGDAGEDQPGGDHESIAQSDTTRQCCGTYAQQKPAGQQPTSTWSASSAGCRFSGAPAAGPSRTVAELGHPHVVWLFEHVPLRTPGGFAVAWTSAHRPDFRFAFRGRKAHPGRHPTWRPKTCSKKRRPAVRPGAGR
jgi:hypothetical protein